MAKGNFTQKDLMIWTMEQPNGTKFFYVIEKEPFQTEGFKKSVHRVGSNFGDAVFRYLDQAEAELAKWPPGEEAKAPEAAPAHATDPSVDPGADPGADSGADPGAHPGGAPPAGDGENEANEESGEPAAQPEAQPKADPEP